MNAPYVLAVFLYDLSDVSRNPDSKCDHLKPVVRSPIYLLELFC